MNHHRRALNHDRRVQWGVTIFARHQYGSTTFTSWLDAYSPRLHLKQQLAYTDGHQPNTVTVVQEDDFLFLPGEEAVAEVERAFFLSVRWGFLVEHFGWESSLYSSHKKLLEIAADLATGHVREETSALKTVLTMKSERAEEPTSLLLALSDGAFKLPKGYRVPRGLPEVFHISARRKRDRPLFSANLHPYRESEKRTYGYDEVQLRWFFKEKSELPPFFQDAIGHYMAQPHAITPKAKSFSPPVSHPLTPRPAPFQMWNEPAEVT